MLDRRKFLVNSLGVVSGILYEPAFGKPKPVLENVFESRALLDEGLHWVSEPGALRVCSRVSRAGFNVLIPCVWHGRGTSWNSGLAPWDNRLKKKLHSNSFYNLLQVAAEYNLEVHPWFTVGLRQRNFFNEFTKNSNSKSFDFNNNEFRNFIVDLILEFVDRYPVHGINLDFVRFHSPLAGHEVEREIVVSDVIRRISVGVKKIRKNCVISIDAAPYQQNRMKLFGQDSIKWAEEGIVDVVYSMQYHDKPDFEVINKIKLGMKRPESLVVMVGNYDRKFITQEVVARAAYKVNDLLLESRKNSSGNGVALYYYGRLNDEQINMFRKNVFSRSAETKWSRAT